MRKYQRIVIGTLGVLVLGIIGLTVYGLQVYKDTSSTFEHISKPVDRKTKRRSETVNIEKREPFSILLLGIDTGALGRTEQGRSDSMMVVTVNPEKKQSASAGLLWDRRLLPIQLWENARATDRDRPD